MQAFVLEMLESNGGCELPCWWGIVPGETRWEEMRAFFAAQGIGVGESGHLDLSYPNQKRVKVVILDVEMQRQGDLVQSIRVNTPPYYYPDSFRDDLSLALQRYELAQVLSRYGVPSQVYLDLMVGAACPGPGVTPVYKMWVVYEDLGVAVLYSGTLISDLDGWLLCPVSGQDNDVFGSSGFIGIWLQSPDLDRPIVSLEPGDMEFIITGTLMELAGMSVQEFYEIFSNPIPQKCALVSNPSPPYSYYDEVIQLTDLPGMTNDEEDAFLVNMLAGNNGCDLPCWWGITPGVTGWQDAQQMFLSLGRRIGIRQQLAGYLDESGEYVTSNKGTAHDVSLFGRHAQYPFDYIVRHTFYERGGTVQLLSVIGHTLGGDTWYTSGWPAPQYFVQDWRRYTLDQILSRFGPPSQVLLHYWAEEGAVYIVAVVYEDRGIMVSYMGPVQVGDDENTDGPDTVAICPTPDQITDINILLKSPELEDSLVDVFNKWMLGRGQYNFPFSECSSQPLEDATGMSLETFYTTYLDPNTQVCMEALVELADMFP